MHIQTSFFEGSESSTGNVIENRARPKIITQCIQQVPKVLDAERLAYVQGSRATASVWLVHSDTH